MDYSTFDLSGTDFEYVGEDECFVDPAEYFSVGGVQQQAHMVQAPIYTGDNVRSLFHDSRAYAVPQTAPFDMMLDQGQVVFQDTTPFAGPDYGMVERLSVDIDANLKETPAEFPVDAFVSFLKIAPYLL